MTFTKEDWQIAELQLDEQKLFVLWAIHVSFCRTLGDFARHFGGETIVEIVGELEQSGAVFDHEGVLCLTDTGVAAVSTLRANEESAFSEIPQRHTRLVDIEEGMIEDSVVRADADHDHGTETPSSDLIPRGVDEILDAVVQRLHSRVSATIAESDADHRGVKNIRTWLLADNDIFSAECVLLLRLLGANDEPVLEQIDGQLRRLIYRVSSVLYDGADPASGSDAPFNCRICEPWDAIAIDLFAKGRHDFSPEKGDRETAQTNYKERFETCGTIIRETAEFLKNKGFLAAADMSQESTAASM
ncbi:MAG: hypothetical protein O3C40_28095 [Planctomycetota bacterium]|nr:hypothetical protein [Planctomycetota bacterium]